jgi:hypothetical protein
LLGCTKTINQPSNTNNNQGNANQQEKDFGLTDNDLVVGNPMDDSLPDTTSNVPDEPIE